MKVSILTIQTLLDSTFFLQKQILISIIAVLQYIVKTLLIKVAKLVKLFTTKGFERHLADRSPMLTLVLDSIHISPSRFFEKRPRTTSGNVHIMYFEVAQQK